MEYFSMCIDLTTVKVTWSKISSWGLPTHHRCSAKTIIFQNYFKLSWNLLFSEFLLFIFFLLPKFQNSICSTFSVMHTFFRFFNHFYNFQKIYLQIILAALFNGHLHLQIKYLLVCQFWCWLRTCNKCSAMGSVLLKSIDFLAFL